ncbi:MAG: hypothetical protein ACLVAO_05660 [Clostridium fessum]
MTDKNRIRVGSRDSALAVVQSKMAIAAMQNVCPETGFELITMKTTGDKVLDRPLDAVGGRGLFVKELDQALYEGRCELTVHSLKRYAALSAGGAAGAGAFRTRRLPRCAGSA